MHPLRVINIYDETIADGVGLRLSIYFSGCRHNCKGCHNPESHNPEAGLILDDAAKEEIARRINSNPLLDGITLSGGDPLYNPEALLDFLKFIRKRANKNIWCYTGYIYENLLKDPIRAECLKYIDVLVDGPFVESKKDPRLYFRGSSNQRIIKLKKGKYHSLLECV